MNILSVFTRPGATGSDFEVVWANGLQRQGTLLVHITKAVDDPAVVAELGALHHLLVQRAIFGTDRAGQPLTLDGLSAEEIQAGRLQLRVSSGQIRKLMLGRSKKRHLTPFAYFLASRFYGASIEVSNDTDWIKPRAAMNVESVTVGGPLDDFQHVPSVGLAAVSQHALEQLRIRGNGLDPAGAWHQLRRAIMSCTHELQVSESKRLRDINVHGHSGRCLYSPLTGWNVVVTPPDGDDRGMPVIATVIHEKRRDRDLAVLEI